MKMKRMLLVLTLALLPLIPFTTACDSTDSGCCRICTTGKACGDSCIAQNETCRVGSGCACNGWSSIELDSNGEVSFLARRRML